MATNAADRITTYYLALADTQRAQLYGIRHLEGLSLASEGGTLWVKGLSSVQVESVAVKTIPFKKVYAAREGSLFAPGSLLPAGPEPALLWTPIARALPLRLPGQGQYEAVDARVLSLALVADSTERPAEALLVSLSALENYLLHAPAVRLRPLRWVLLREEALVLGTPLLPLPGAVFWRQQNLLLPAGSRLRLPLLAGALQQRLDPRGEQLILWRPEGCSLIDPALFRPLTLASFRKSLTAPHG